MKLSRDLMFNLAFWTLYFFYQWFGLGFLYGGLNNYFVNACLALPPSLIFSLLVMHIYFPAYYKTNRKTRFWIFTLLTSLILLTGRRYFNYHVIYPRFFRDALHMPLWSPFKLLVDFVNLYTITGLYALYYFICYWYKEQQKIQGLVQQKILAELNLLKAQVQPHFVFNTLNNIYSSAVKTDPETAELITHLSGFLEYSLYDASRDTVPLISELDVINHYVQLQKNRYGTRLDVSINIIEMIDDIEIAPLLLLPIIENCFKFGVAGSTGQSWVRIDVGKKNGRLVLSIENSHENLSNKNTRGGIGLSNLKKRLELIYHEQFKLRINEDLNAYLVQLEIPLKPVIKYSQA